LKSTPKKLPYNNWRIRAVIPISGTTPRLRVKTLQELSAVKKWVTDYEKLTTGIADIFALIDLATEAEDEEIDQKKRKRN